MPNKYFSTNCPNPPLLDTLLSSTLIPSSFKISLIDLPIADLEISSISCLLYNVLI